MKTTPVCSLGLVLHSPGNLAIFPRADLLLANIATLIFLPNDKAQDAALKPHYEALGLNGREIAMLAEDMRPKQDYYCVQGKHRRRFQLQSGPLERAVLGVNGRDHKARVLALRAQHGAHWPVPWLTEQGHDELARQWAARVEITESEICMDRTHGGTVTKGAMYAHV